MWVLNRTLRANLSIIIRQFLLTFPYFTPTLPIFLIPYFVFPILSFIQPPLFLTCEITKSTIGGEGLIGVEFN